MLQTIQRTLERHMDSVTEAFEGALLTLDDESSQLRTAVRVDANLRHLKTELNTFAKMCDTLKHTVNALDAHDKHQQTLEAQKIAAVVPVKITHGEYKGHWYCSAADDDFVCRCGPNHGGRFGFRPTRERKKVTKHIEAQHKPRMESDRRIFTSDKTLRGWVAENDDIR